MRYWDEGHMDSAVGVAMLLGMLGFWSLLILGVVLVVRAGTTTYVAPPTRSTRPFLTGPRAEEILAERLARGEIDPEEFATRLDALRSSATTSRSSDDLERE
jgi:putative membrane protein